MADVKFLALIVGLVLSHSNWSGSTARTYNAYKFIPLSPEALSSLFSEAFLSRWDNKVQGIMSTIVRTRRYPKRRYLQGKVGYYSNSNATFNIELIRAGDIELNPGDIRNPCSVCGKPVARTHRALDCSTCQLRLHIKCSSVTPAVYYEIMARLNYYWECSSFLWRMVSC